MMKKWISIFLLGAMLASCQDGSVDTAPEDTISEGVLIDEDITTSDLTTSDMSDAEKAAIERFIYQEGEWTSVWTFYGEDGKASGNITGTESFSFLVDKHSQMLTNVIPALKHTSYAMLAYSPAEQHVIFMNIGPGGDYWVMRENPLTGVMVSDPHLNADGTETIQMFTALNRTDNTFEVVMEKSENGGETWKKGFTQKLTRIIYEE